MTLDESLLKQTTTLNKRITIRIPKEYREKLEQCAKENGQTLSGYIRYNIIEYLKNYKNDSKIENSANNFIKEVSNNKNTRQIEVEISNNLYNEIEKLIRLGMFHGPPEIVLSNEIERILLRELGNYLKHLKQNNDNDDYIRPPFE